MKTTPSSSRCPECREFLSGPMRFCPSCGAVLDRREKEPCSERGREKKNSKSTWLISLFVMILFLSIFLFSSWKQVTFPLHFSKKTDYKTDRQFQWDGEYLTFPTGDFYIRLPKKPSFDHLKAETPYGLPNEYLFVSEKENIQCRVLFMPLPDKMAAALDFSRPASVIEELISFGLLHGHSLNVSPLLFYNQYSGIEFLLEILPQQGAPLTSRGRAFLKDKNLYIMETIRPFPRSGEELMISTEWIDSFGLIHP
ncbi:MAG TPA: hypothetical protein ENN72_09255 [Firmicutes bacterium]|nr:hypothetical protein [Bacillota bacterium]